MLLAWIAVCGLLAVAFHRRPVLLVCLTLTLATLVPAIAGYEITGVSNSLTPAVWLIFALFVVQVFLHPRAFGEALVRRFVFIAICLLIVAVAVYETKVGNNGHGLVKIFIQVFSPLLAFWVLAASSLRGEEDVAGMVVRTVLRLAAVESVIALLQYSADSGLVFSKAYSHAYWYVPGYDRWMGTTDSALDLAVFLAAAITMLKSVRSSLVRSAGALLFLAGILVTQSRTGVFVGVLATVYVLLSSRSYALGKVVSLGVLAVVGAYAASTQLGAGVADRVNGTDATGLSSTRGREDAYGYFAGHFQHYILSGGGIDSSYKLASDLGLASSFESAFIIYSLDLGVLFAALFFLSQIVVALRSAARDKTGAWVAALVVIGVCQTFSSIGSANALGLLIFVLLAAAAYPSVGGESSKRVPAAGAARDLEGVGQ